MSTTGHESEVICVDGLKASLQKLKDTHIDTKVANVAFDSASGKLKKTVDGVATDVCEIYTKSQVDAMRSPSYNPATKRYTFPANATFEYLAASKKIILSH